MKTFKESVVKKEYNFYGEESFILPYKKSSSKIETFTLGKYIDHNDLEKEYEKRGLIPAHPSDVLDFWTDEKYLATHWKDADGKWCFASFYRWVDGKRIVFVHRFDDDWGDRWWFAGVRQSFALEPVDSDPLSLDLRLKKVEKYLSETFKDYD